MTITKEGQDSIRIINQSDKTKEALNIVKHKSAIQKVIAMEKAGKKLKKHGCTTVSFYFIKLGEEVSFFADGTCSWGGGYRNLLAHFRPNEPIPE